MPPKLEEITAIFRWEKHRWNDTVIASCTLLNGDSTGKEVSIKCTAGVDEFRPALSYRFFGRWTKYRNKRTGETEDQFQAKTFVRSKPHGQAGTIRYLMEAPHVGQAIAKRLWEIWQGDSVRILREEPGTVAAIIGGQFNLERATEAAKYLEREAGREDCTIDLIDLLGGRGFPRATGKKCVEEWGNEASELIRRNPFLLMRFRGCGFSSCDKMYLDLGGNPARLKRQALCGWYTLSRRTNETGNTWHAASDFRAGLVKMVGSTDVRPRPAALLGKRGRLIDTYRDKSGGNWFADSRKAASEERLAEKVIDMLGRPAAWPVIVDLDVSEHQRETVYQALQGRLSILTGSPGTGKTYAGSRMIGKVADRHGLHSIAVCAPTGKAAVRISEALEGYGIPLRARTVHSLLRVSQRSYGEGWSFEHDEDCPLDERFIFVDEASMIDTDLMASLLVACDVTAHVLLIGDTNQLPPVGHGAPLRDLIAAGVPCGELREIRRNSGTIVKACAAIRDGKPVKTDEQLRPADGRNMKLVDGGKGKQAQQAIVELLGKLSRRYDPTWDCQVICAVNAKSDLSRKTLNELLQAELNPDGKRIKGSPFRVGDKVVCLKNGFVPTIEVDHSSPDEVIENDDGGVYVANGEVGRVLAVDEKLTVMEFAAPRRVVRVPRGQAKDDADGEDESGTGCNFDLAYAISCHKSQGSEFPVVIVALDEYPGARRVCSREWIYTAISRAKELCLLVGKGATIKSVCRRSALDKRKTFLRERVEDGLQENADPGEGIAECCTERDPEPVEADS